MVDNSVTKVKHTRDIFKTRLLKLQIIAFSYTRVCVWCYLIIMLSGDYLMCFNHIPSYLSVM